MPFPVQAGGEPVPLAPHSRWIPVQRPSNRDHYGGRPLDLGGLDRQLDLTYGQPAISGSLRRIAWGLQTYKIGRAGSAARGQSPGQRGDHVRVQLPVPLGHCSPLTSQNFDANGVWADGHKARHPFRPRSYVEVQPPPVLVGGKPHVTALGAGGCQGNLGLHTFDSRPSLVLAASRLRCLALRIPSA